MKKQIIGLGLLILCASFGVFANNLPILNSVQMQLSAEQWVSTHSALITVAVDETLVNKSVGEVQQALLKNLASLARADWHVTSVNLSTGESGLQKMHVMAQARVSNNAVSGLQQRVKSLSKAGRQFTLASVSFAPSMQALATASVSLRQQIYQQAKAELAQLNKDYPKQHFFIHQMSFNQQVPRVGLAFRTLHANATMPVARHLVLSANVTLSSKLAS